uniref:Monoglyceride lipase n=1 Tax=Noccaea caerulescens TaxID=107243 RepID=A0A1J3IHF3_NOCCA
MIYSSGGTIVIASGYSFPRLPVEKSSRFYVNEIRNHLPINVTARRRSSMAVDAMAVRSKYSSLAQLSGASDRVSAVFSIRELKQKKRKRNIGCCVSPLPTPTPTTVVDEEVAVRRGLAMRRVLEDDGGDGSSVRDFSLFTTKRGDTLFTQSWTRVGSVKNRGLVVLLHGLNEHSGRYSDFAKQLNVNGFKVYGIDWIGHGGSDGLHAYVPSLDYAVTDLNLFLEKVIAENPRLPCFCIGHSTGGAIILKAMLDPKIEARVSGIVLTSPAVGVQPSHPIFGVLAPFLAFLIPRYQLSAAKKKVRAVSRDPEALVAKYSDPLVYTGSIRARTGYEILRLASHLLENLNRIKVPFLVMHGTADTVTDPKGTQRLYDEASSSDKSIKLFDGLLHDLLFEPERGIIAGVILDWLNRRV